MSGEERAVVDAKPRFRASGPNVGQCRAVSGRFTRLAGRAELATSSCNPRCAGARQAERPCAPGRVLRRAQAVASNSHSPTMLNVGPGPVHVCVMVVTYFAFLLLNTLGAPRPPFAGSRIL